MTERAFLVVSLTLWFGLLLAALAISVLAAIHDTLPGDREIMDWQQDQPLPGQDLSDALRTITGTEVVLATGGAVSLTLWLRGFRRQALLLVAGLVTLAIVQPAIKELVDRPRPDPGMVDVRAGYSSSSFPSGHVMSGTLLYGFLLFLSRSLPFARVPAAALGIAAGAVVALAGAVNVWLGVHWPSDALGAWLWACVILVPLIIGYRLSSSDLQFL